MIKVKQKGDFKNSLTFMHKCANQEEFNSLDKYGKIGVDALYEATPKDTGKTAASWDYQITKTKDNVSISWYNTNLTENGIPIAVLIQYGHGMPNGKYVQGIDYINPAIKPVFDQIAEDVWKEVVDK